MKKSLLAAVLGLGVLAATTPQASANGYCLNFGGFGFGIWTKNSAHVGCGYCHGCPSLGPWYLYWPHAAHFQTPAMPEYPYWGQPMTAGGYCPSYWHGH
jgi:hypothetical protein